MIETLHGLSQVDIDNYGGEILATNLLEAIIHLPSILSAGSLGNLAKVGKNIFEIGCIVRELRMGASLGDKIMGYPPRPSYRNWVPLTNGLMVEKADDCRKLIRSLESMLLSHWKSQDVKFPIVWALTSLRGLCVIYMAYAAYRHHVNGGLLPPKVWIPRGE